MKKLQKIAALLLCLCMALGMTAMAEETAITEIAAEAVIANVNGEDILWSDAEGYYTNLVAQYGSYYDLTQASDVELFRAVAMENVITERLLMQKAVEFGLSELTAEEAAELEVTAQADWDAALESYLSYFHSELTDDSAEADVAAARAEAEAYYNENGYDLQILTEEYKRYAVMDKVQSLMMQDATVTDQEVEELYQALVATDKELYENDIAAYVDYVNQVDMMAMYAAMYGMESDMDYPWYKPEGFRAVKHILLPVDETLMDTYTDLQARYEEQQTPAADDTEADAAETTEEAVTAEMVNEAKAAILASLADTIDEINQKIADGADFDELIAVYGVNADGTASDPGMTSEPYMTSGYEVCAASSNYVPEFVEASMSIAEVGGVSAPYLSDYGIHIVKYIGDVAGGPIEMTEAQREAKRATLLESKQSELYTSTMESWMEEAAVTYTGIVTPLEQVQG